LDLDLTKKKKLIPPQLNKAVALVDAVVDASAKEVIIWPVYNNN
jgi:hypothetical protein